MQPRLSVVVCTRNRAPALRRCLASLVAQTLSAVELELVVVDNGSTDATAAVAAECLARRAGVRCVSEPAVGLSRARNTGVQSSTADVVAFIDDDARASPAWAAALAAAYARHPSAAAVGGPIVLDWGGRRPAWLPAELESLYSGLDLGPDPRWLDGSESPFGANFSVRRDAIEAAGGFDHALGRSGHQLVGGEEAALLERVRPRGGVFYEPAARVVHDVLPDRRSRRWLLRRSYGQGRTDVRRGRVGGDPRRLLVEATTGWRAAGERIRASRDRRGALTIELVRRAQLLGSAGELTRG